MSYQAHPPTRKSNTSSTSQRPRTKILCFRMVEVHFIFFFSFVFLFPLLVILGQLLVSCKGWEGGRECRAPAQPERAGLGRKQGAGQGLMGKNGLWGLQRPEHFLSPVFPKSTVIVFHGLKLWICVCVLLLFDWWEKKMQI